MSNRTKLEDVGHRKQIEWYTTIQKIASISNPDRLEEYIYDSDWSIRCAVVENPITKLSTLRKIILTEENAHVIDAIVNHPNTNASLLYYIYHKYPNPYIHRQIFSQPECPQPLLYVAEKSNNPFDHISLSTNPNLPVDIIERLSKHNYSSVRCGIASNPATPLRILNILKNDPAGPVRVKAIYQINSR